jgi:citrate lyase subunit beta / citryl-CoA lyase
VAYASSPAARSYLYVPGDRPDHLAKALARGADALVVDLEDAVAPEAKAAAAELAGAWLADHPAPPADLWVRVNPESLASDIAATLTAGVRGVVLPKAAPDLLAQADELLAAQEQRLGAPSGTFAVIPLIETARGIMACAQIAGTPRVARLIIGEADLAADLRLRLTDAREEMRPLRMQVVVASAAAGIGAPVGPVWADFQDLGELARSTQVLADLGFRARTAIHPRQIAVINEVFTPTAEEARAARELVSSFEAAGGGALIDASGRMVDRALVRTAYETLDRARAGGVN